MTSGDHVDIPTMADTTTWWAPGYAHHSTTVTVTVIALAIVIVSVTVAGLVSMLLLLDRRSDRLRRIASIGAGMLTFAATSSWSIAALHHDEHHPQAATPITDVYAQRDDALKVVPSPWGIGYGPPPVALTRAQVPQGATYHGAGGADALAQGVDAVLRTRYGLHGVDTLGPLADVISAGSHDLLDKARHGAVYHDHSGALLFCAVGVDATRQHVEDVVCVNAANASRQLKPTR